MVCYCCFFFQHVISESLADCHRTFPMLGRECNVAAGPAVTYEFLHIYTYFRPISLQCIASTVRPHIFSYIVSSVIVVFLC